MSAFKSAAERQNDFQKSFSALVECLQKGLREPGTVNVPSDIIAPFRKTFQPTESAHLRDLAKVLESGRPKNVVRLDSVSFYHVVAITFHFPPSAVQNKLLYLFMVGRPALAQFKNGLPEQETIDQYKNESTLASLLSRVYGTTMTAAKVQDEGDYIGRKLSIVVLRHLVSNDKASEWRWRLAQFLSVLVRVSSAARGQIVGMSECEYLTTIVHSNQSHLFRILVANSLRVLLATGAERSVFTTSPTSRKALEKFPLSKTVDSKWMSEVLAYLSQVDAARTKTYPGELQHQQAFAIQHLECDGHPLSKHDSIIVASISSAIFFLVPGAHFLLISVPISKTMVLKRTSSGPSPSILEIQYPGDEGDRFMNGTRSAISRILVTFCDEEGIEAFTATLEEQRNVEALDEVTEAVRPSRKQSLAVIDISSDSVDNNEEENHYVEAVATSEVGVSLPLRNISLRTRQKKGPDPLISKQGSTTGSRPRMDSGEDTPALKKGPDPRQLIDRLRASQEETKNTDLEARSSSHQSPLHRSPSGLFSTEGKSRLAKSPHLPLIASVPAPSPNGATSSKSRPSGKQPAELISTSLSNQAKKRSKAAPNTRQASDETKSGHSSRKRGQATETMARLTGAGQGDSQASAVATKTGLKRRANKEPVTSNAEDSQKRPMAVLAAAEFDLLPSDDEDNRPAKKPKTKNGKPAAKATVKAPADKKKNGVQVAASPKVSKKSAKEKPKAKKSPEKKPQTTVASTRVRRAAKTPKYIEDSDDSGEDNPTEESDDEQEVEDGENKDNEEETAEDSFPPDREVLDAAMAATQDEFESQFLPEMVEELSTDDEAQSKGKKAVRNSNGQQQASADQPAAQRLSEQHQQTASKEKLPISKAMSMQSGSKDKSVLGKPAKKEVTNKVVSTLREPQAEHAAVEEHSPMQISVAKQIASKDKSRIPDRPLPLATPRHSTKRLSESSILPTSEKLLRKTPIVHFGPQGPVDQAVQRRRSEEEITISCNSDDTVEPPTLLQATEPKLLERSHQHAQGSSPQPESPSTRHVFIDDEAQDDAPAESYEFAPPSELAADLHIEAVDEALQDLTSEEAAKSPEIDETQPRSPREDDSTQYLETEEIIEEVPIEETPIEEAPVEEAPVEEAPVEEAPVEEAPVEEVPIEEVPIEETPIETLNVQSVDMDETSSVDDSQDQEASEYLESEVEEEIEEEASLEPLEAPELQPPRRPKALEYRPQTPLLDDDSPLRSSQRAKAPPILRRKTRQSIGVTTILDDDYPTTQKALNLKSFKPVPKSAEEQKSSTSDVSTAAPAPPAQILTRPELPGSFNAATSMRVAPKSRTTHVAPSNSTKQVASTGKSNEHILKFQPRKENIRSAFPHTAHNLENARRTDNVSVTAPTEHTFNRTDSTDMTASLSSLKAPQSMAPPPSRKALSTRVTSKPEPRRSWPESQIERKKRVIEAPAKEEVHIPGPVRVKKRLTLPLAADEQLPEPDLFPATPASFSTRLDFHADLPNHAAHSKEDSIMEDAGHELRNHSLTLVNDEHSIVRDRTAHWTRKTRRRRSHSTSDTSMSVSPSRRQRHGLDGNGQMIAGLHTRESQLDLARAIRDITDDVLFRFGAEDDALKAKVDQYQRGGRAIVETLSDTWIQRLRHEEKLLADGLEAEKSFLSKAVHIVAEKTMDEPWREQIFDKEVLGKVQEKGATLASMINALRQAE